MTRPTAMPNDSKPALVPKLRFPEFLNSGPWNEKPLREAVSPVVREKQKPDVPYKGLGVRSHGKGTFIKENADPEKNAMESLYEVKPHDLVVNITFAWEGAVAIAKPEDDGALVSHRFPTYVFNREVAISEFFQYVISNKKFVYDLGVISPGGAGRNRVLNKNDFLKLRTPIPDVAEQKKIAECLSTLDELIGAESQKLDALKAHKKGLMQQLFPREGETRPRLRFPEFQNAPEWRGRQLDDVLESITNGLSTPQNGGVNGFRVTRIETISSQIIDLTKVGFISTDQDISSYKLRIGDILFSNINSISHIGKTAFVGQEYDLYHGMNLLRLIVNKAENHPLFIYYLLNTEGVRESFRARANKAVNQASINQTELGRTAVTLPKKEEQQRIATCLSSLDELIAVQSDRLSALQTHKQGLLQQLFPALS